MGRYNPNVGGSLATLLLLPKSDQRFAVSEPKTFFRKSIDQKTKEERDVYGVQYTLRLKGGDYDGKTQPLQFYLHTEGGYGMAKQFVMACSGYDLNPEGEAEFNAAFPDGDWGFDTDTGEVGEMWKKPTGALVEASVDERTNPNNTAQKNQTYRWRPVKG